MPTDSCPPREKSRLSPCLMNCGDSRADCLTMTGTLQSGRHDEPVAVRHFVFQQDGWLIKTSQQQVQISIPIDVPIRQTSPNGVQFRELP